MRKTRILLVDMSPLLRDIMARLIAAHADLEVTGSIRGGGGHLADTVRESAPDVIVVGTDPSDFADVIAYLVDIRSAIRVVAVGGDGHHAVLCSPLGEVSADGLLAALRTPAQQ
ncbi:chemotaxis response regulator CheB [Kibdelosporangium banguiense]|uniref:Chemotaxis response regulator CheB n=1 Tax=Kibdelosporangium banguiense TaxID=1365924 RepID=A0ABS4TQ63_9PSEU|nr:hypothetical protein [Kibdelosporangium banguiense]MBP2326550.1 chemotaxis response regulator CheB [Kibdelosporangium banguiense]